MNCYYHDQNNSVAQCPDCKRGLCKNCSNKFSIPICASCNNSWGNIEKRLIYYEIFATVGVGLILAFFLSSVMYSRPNHSISVKEYIPLLYTYFGVYPGWKLLNEIFPKFYFNFSISYFVLLFIKFISSFFVGAIVLPIVIYKNINRLIQLNKNK